MFIVGYLRDRPAAFREISETTFGILRSEKRKYAHPQENRLSLESKYFNGRVFFFFGGVKLDYDK